MTALLHERIQFVLPGICKAYPTKWAAEFISAGTLYFTNLNEFVSDKNPERGDVYEGMGIANRQDQRCKTKPVYPVFVCCFTMETDAKVILETWKDRDIVVQIYNTLRFTHRIRDAADNAVEIEKNILSFQVGPVTYDKDEGSNQSHSWNWSTFQKNRYFSGQKEFRFAFVGASCLKNKKNIVLQLGNCSDIAQVLK